MPLNVTESETSVPLTGQDDSTRAGRLSITG
jgi:hypothetical protein